MKKLVVLTGAGVSAESGLKTFRDSGGLWEGFNVMDVASPEGWNANPEMVLQFYNERRKKARLAEPNKGHKILAELEQYFNVHVITQNVDDLHERAGSSNVLHIHGSLFQSRSSLDESLVYDMSSDTINIGDLCEKGSQLRPNVVWFGEMVPLMQEAANIAHNADLFLVVGTSMVVYPAAGLIEFVKPGIPKFIVDPNVPELYDSSNIFFFVENATTGMALVRDKLIQEFLK